MTRARVLCAAVRALALLFAISVLALPSLAASPALHLLGPEEGSAITDCLDSVPLFFTTDRVPYDATFRALAADGRELARADWTNRSLDFAWAYLPTRDAAGAWWPEGPTAIEASVTSAGETARETRNVTFERYEDAMPPTARTSAWSHGPKVGEWFLTPPVVTLRGLDECRVRGVNATLDGAPVATEPGSGSGFLEVADPRSVARHVHIETEGVHVVEARATDLAGNVGPATNVTVRVDLTPPVVRIAEPTQGDVIALGFRTQAGLDETIVVGCAWLHATADGGGVPVRIDAWTGDPDVAWFDGETYLGPHDPAGYLWCPEAGEHALQARAWDRGGRVGASPTLRVTSL